MTNAEIASTEAVVEDKLIAAMQAAEVKSPPALMPTLKALTEQAQAREAEVAKFIPQTRKAIEVLVDDKIFSIKTDAENINALIESKGADVKAKIEEMRNLQSDIVKLMAEVGHLRTHKVILDMAAFSHGQALGEIVAQAPTR